MGVLFLVFIHLRTCVRDELWDACYIADVKAVRNLLDMDPNELRPGKLDVSPDRTDKEHGRTGLMVCGYDPQTKNSTQLDLDCTNIAKQFKRVNANLSAVDETGWDALHMGAIRGLTQFCSYLLSNGVISDRQDSEGRTALMKAAGHGHISTAKMLLKNGANISLMDNSGLTALHYATHLAMKNKSHVPLLESLLNTSTSPSPDDCKDFDHRTPLMHLLIDGSAEGEEAVRALLHLGADPRLRDASGTSALDMAASRSPRVTTLLAEAIVTLVEKEHAQWMASSALALNQGLNDGRVVDIDVDW